jgi:hypothetical protein
MMKAPWCEPGMRALSILPADIYGAGPVTVIRKLFTIWEYQMDI